jgi:hypothetical protein
MHDSPDYWSMSDVDLAAIWRDVDMKAGTPVRWVPGEGWVEATK